MIAEAEAAPWQRLTPGSHERLYALKGEVLRRGVAAVLGVEMPIYPKRRFQHGAIAGDGPFELGDQAYRDHFAGLHRAS